MTPFIVGTSALLQLLAAAFSIRMIKLTGRTVAWMLISLALSLMAVRRSITLYRMLTESQAYQPDVGAELVAMSISTILVLGVAGIAPIFRRLRDQDRLLREIVKGTSSNTGSQFFRSLVTHLSAALGARCAFIAECVEDATRSSTIAVCDQGKLIDNFVYDLRDTPCGLVLDHENVCFYPADVCAAFPNDQLLVDMHAESYLGTPLFGTDGEVTGLLVVVHDGPLGSPEATKNVVNLFAERASAELQRQRAEDSRSEAEQQSQLVLDTVADPIVTIDQEGVIHAFGQAAESVFGFAADEAIGKPFTLLLASGSNAQSREETLQRYMAMGLAKVFATPRELEGTRKDGTTFPIEVTVNETTLRGEPYFVGIIRDITESQRTNREIKDSRRKMRMLASHLQTAQEAERKRIAHEIHDELGQTLTVLKMNLAWLSEKQATGVDAHVLREKLAAATDLSSSALREVRSLAAGLRPTVLDDFGITAALDYLIQEFKAQTGIDCRFERDDQELVFAPGPTASLYRICQEALTNVARHANATALLVRFLEREDHVFLEITDNGDGIAIEKTQSPNSFGISGMSERATTWGGTYEIKSVPSGGTQVRVELPLCRVRPNKVRPAPVDDAESV